MENILSLNNLSLNTEATTNDITDLSCKSAKAEIKWKELGDSFLMIAFAVGVYSQVFSFFLYAFTY